MDLTEIVSIINRCMKMTPVTNGTTKLDNLTLLLDNLRQKFRTLTSKSLNADQYVPRIAERIISRDAAFRAGEDETSHFTACVKGRILLALSHSFFIRGRKAGATAFDSWHHSSRCIHTISTSPITMLASVIQ